MTNTPTPANVSLSKYQDVVQMEYVGYDGLQRTREGILLDDPKNNRYVLYIDLTVEADKINDRFRNARTRNLTVTNTTKRIETKKLIALHPSIEEKLVRKAADEAA